MQSFSHFMCLRVMPMPRGDCGRERLDSFVRRSDKAWYSIESYQKVLFSN